MSKTRMINTRFWSDAWVRKLNALDRYLFMYFLTNEHTNICGVYELPIGTIAYETGIDERDLEKTMIPRLAPKLYYIDEWVYLRNFEKHQSFNESVKIGMAKAKKDIPDRILAKINDILGKDTGCIQGVTGCGVSESELESKPEPKSNIPFSKFWEIYPKKTGKKKAEEYWKNLKIEDQQKILEDIPNRKNDDKWKGGFIKDPERYIKYEQWNDEIIVNKGKVQDSLKVNTGKYDSIKTTTIKQ